MRCISKDPVFDNGAIWLCLFFVLFFTIASIMICQKLMTYTKRVVEHICFLHQRKKKCVGKMKNVLLLQKYIKQNCVSHCFSLKTL